MTWDKVDDGMCKGEMFSFHGKRFSTWLFQGRKDTLPKYLILPTTFDNEDITYIIAYVRVLKPNLVALVSEVLKYIDGKNNLLCTDQNIPLIASTENKSKYTDFSNNREICCCIIFAYKC